jgi:hypothetical protein
LKAAPHPPYSPDLAPSDFYLFGYAKGYLTGPLFEGADEFIEAVQGVLERIQKGTLQAVFLEGMDRLKKCIAGNGE